MTLTISWPKWKEYQGDGLRHEKTSWLRLQNDLLDHDLWEDLEPLEWKAFTGLLMLTSRRAHKTGVLTLRPKRDAEKFGIPIEVIESTIHKLVSHGVATAHQTATEPGPRGVETVSKPSANRPDPVLRNDTERNDTISSSTTTSTAPENFSQPDEPEDPVPVGDVVIRNWLHELGIRGCGYAAWVALHGPAKVEHGLREAYARDKTDDTFFDPLPEKPFQTRRQRIPEALANWIAKAKPPPGGAAIPLPESKAEKRVTYCGECENGWRSKRVNGCDFAEPCPCTAEKLCEGGAA